MRHNRRWTEDEELVIFRHVGASPYNLKRSFENASEELGRTVKAVELRWYTKLCKEQVTFLTYGRETLNRNRKNVYVNSSDNTETKRKSLWKKICSLLSC